MLIPERREGGREGGRKTSFFGLCVFVLIPTLDTGIEKNTL